MEQSLKCIYKCTVTSILWSLISKHFTLMNMIGTVQYDFAIQHDNFD